MYHMNFFKSKINEKDSALVMLQEQFDSLNSKYSELEEQFKTASEMSSTYKGEFERLDQENKDLKEQIEQSNKAVEEVIQENVSVNELAALKAVEILAEAGTAPIEVLEDESESASIDKQSYIEKMNDLKGLELLNFYRKHKVDMRNQK